MCVAAIASALGELSIPDAKRAKDNRAHAATSMARAAMGDEDGYCMRIVGCPYGLFSRLMIT